MLLKALEQKRSAAGYPAMPLGAFWLCIWASRGRSGGVLAINVPISGAHAKTSGTPNRPDGKNSAIYGSTSKTKGNRPPENTYITQPVVLAGFFDCLVPGY